MIDEASPVSAGYCAGDVAGERGGRARVLRRDGALLRVLLQEPPPLVAAEQSGDLWPEYEEALGYADPEVEWQTVFLGATHRGRREIARAWDDFLRWTEGYKIRLEEIEDLDADRVFAVLTVSSMSKDGGSFGSRHFDIVTVQDGLIVRLAEFTDREQALETLGLSE